MFQNTFCQVFLALVSWKLVSCWMFDEVRLYGNFKWELLFNLDNSDNSAPLIQTLQYKTISQRSYTTLLTEAYKIRVGGSVASTLGLEYADVFNAQVTTNASVSVETSYSAMVERKEEQEITIIKKDTFIVGPHSKLKIYNLVYYGPGLMQKTDIISTTQHGMEVIAIDATLRITPVLEDLRVYQYSEYIDIPSNVIKGAPDSAMPLELDFSVDGCNWRTWLVPIWTPDISKGATSIELVIQNNDHPDYSDYTRGCGGKYYFLKVKKNPRSSKKITDVALARFSLMDLIEGRFSSYGYEQMTGDMNENRNVYWESWYDWIYIHLLWTTKKVNNTG